MTSADYARLCAGLVVAQTHFSRFLVEDVSMHAIALPPGAKERFALVSAALIGLRNSKLAGLKGELDKCDLCALAAFFDPRTPHDVGACKAYAERIASRAPADDPIGHSLEILGALEALAVNAMLCEAGADDGTRARVLSGMAWISDAHVVRRSDPRVPQETQLSLDAQCAALMHYRDEIRATRSFKEHERMAMLPEDSYAEIHAAVRVYPWFPSAAIGPCMEVLAFFAVLANDGRFEESDD